MGITVQPADADRRGGEQAQQQFTGPVAADLGVAEWCVRRWMKQDDIDSGRAEGLSTDERAQLVRLRLSGYRTDQAMC
jgi:hypothetical protein